VEMEGLSFGASLIAMDDGLCLSVSGFYVYYPWPFLWGLGCHASHAFLKLIAYRLIM